MADAGLERAVAALERALARVGARHMLIGGVAVVARGVRRLTDDVDATLWGEDVEFERLLLLLAKERIEPRIEDAIDFAKTTQVFLLRHEPSGIDIDLSIARLPFENAALDRADKVRMGRTRVPIARPEDLIVYKSIAGRERDRSDVERLLEMYGSALNLARIRRTVRDLAEALDEPQLADALDAAIRKAVAPHRRGAKSKSKRTSRPRRAAGARRRK